MTWAHLLVAHGTPEGVLSDTFPPPTTARHYNCHPGHRTPAVLQVWGENQQVDLGPPHPHPAASQTSSGHCLVAGSPALSLSPSFHHPSFSSPTALLIQKCPLDTFISYLYDSTLAHNFSLAISGSSMAWSLKEPALQSERTA